ncbi:MAG TPA: helix-turn-helix domain-containing protein [Streptosporangiales bacterium]
MAEDAWSLFASLTEPQRRDLYTYVREQHRPVTREEAAEACGMSRSLAAFHLDKLVESGLLGTARPADGGSKRTRGRPPKAYETTDVEIRFVLPERRLDLLADVLMDAVAVRPDNAWQEAVDNGRRSGEQIGREYRPRRRGGKRGRAALTKALTDVGAEPHAVGDNLLVLANCPFRASSRRRPELVCEIYRAFCAGIANGVGVNAQAVAEPSPGNCCVAVRW